MLKYREGSKLRAAFNRKPILNKNLSFEYCRYCNFVQILHFNDSIYLYIYIYLKDNFNNKLTKLIFIFKIR